jgi:hypothetical protein
MVAWVCVNLISNQESFRKIDSVRIITITAEQREVWSRASEGANGMRVLSHMEAALCDTLISFGLLLEHGSTAGHKPSSGTH